MSLLAPGRNLVLIGPMGAGKTTVGRLLADRLRRPFADTDAMVEREAGRPVREIFDESGERAFRALESEMVRRVSALRGQVIAVGGGALGDPLNLTHLRSTGDLVLLDAPPEALAERVGGGGDAAARPLLRGADDLAARLASLRDLRDADYNAAAAHPVETAGKTPEEVAAEVLAWARTRPGLLSRDERRP